METVESHTFPVPSAPCRDRSRAHSFMLGVAAFGAGLFAFPFAVVLLIICLAGGEGDCNVAVVPLHGDLMTTSEVANPLFDEPLFGASSDYIVASIEAADSDESIHAIVLDVDSYGGLPVAGEEVAEALERATKPTAALIHQAGTSAAYWASLGADTIVASEFSDVGSIGVTASYVDAARYNDEEGYTYNELSSGTFKDTGHPDRPLSEEERALIERDIAVIFEGFVRAVATYRNLSEEAVRALADGSSMLGRQALESKLIDRIGSWSDVESLLSDTLGEDAVVCEY